MPQFRGEGVKVWGEEEWWLGVKNFVLWGDYDKNIAVKATYETVEAVEDYTGDEIARGATEVHVETTDNIH